MFIRSKMTVSDCSCYCFVFAMSNGQNGSELCSDADRSHTLVILIQSLTRKGKQMLLCDGSYTNLVAPVQ